MRVLGKNKRGKFFWPKLTLKKWLKLKHKGDDFHADEEDDLESELDDDEKVKFELERRHSCSSTENLFRHSISGGYACQPPRHSSAMLTESDSNILRAKITEKNHFRIFVGTWNVGGKTPHYTLDLEEWLGLEKPADIYVIGFQEVVPLNAGNVLGAEDNSTTVRWLHLIRHTLNNTTCHCLRKSCSDPLSSFEEATNFTKSLDNLCSEKATLSREKSSFISGDYHNLEMRFGGPEAVNYNSFEIVESENTVRSMAFDNEYVLMGKESPGTQILSPILRSRSLEYHSIQNQSRYALLASKQMVGLFLSVWIRGELRQHVHNLKMSCVGCGLMGYLGNKGSISISMSLHQTTFCFICSHLSSGEKEGDELRRNSDVSEILKRTHFPRSNDLTGMGLPENILEHDRIIWFGDLNYRLALSSGATRSLLVKEDWEALLEKDQLQMERRSGRVFEGWHEGKIYFAPTYKYRANSDHYALEKIKLGQKCRMPAWCDRVLWYGRGLKQLAYVRAESKFSDHRPVFAVFLVEVDVMSHQKLKEVLGLVSNKD